MLSTRVTANVRVRPTAISVTRLPSIRLFSTGNASSAGSTYTLPGHFVAQAGENRSLTMWFQANTEVQGGQDPGPAAALCRQQKAALLLGRIRDEPALGTASFEEVARRAALRKKRGAGFL